MKVVIFTLGCKVNKYESDKIAECLKSRGYSVSEKLEKADCYIINTCAVTNEAERKSRQSVSRVLKLNDKAKIFIMGCASEHNHIQFSNDNVVKVLGCQDKFKILEYFPKLIEIETINNDSSVRQFIKVQDGCNNFCTYCLIPYLRGRSKSRSIESIVKEVESLHNTKELILTGIDLSDFKIGDNKALSTLIKSLEFFNGRIRLGSLELNIITQEFLDVLSRCKNFCPHFHLSLQSGCDTVLKRMNRHYKTTDFANAVDLIRKYFPYASITTDIIVGFPKETEEEFIDTFNFTKLVEFSDIHIFPYSKRAGTVALKFGGFVDGEEIKKRTKKLESIKVELCTKFQQKNVGIPLTLLVEEIDEEFGYGYTENYIYTKVKMPCKIGEFVKGTFDKDFIFKKLSD